MVMSQKKYWQIFKISLEEYFVYRLNFVMWRVRSFVSLLTVYFLWEFASSKTLSIFTYSRSQILTYVVGTHILRSLVMGVRSAGIAGEIASGDLSNYLLKPVSYLKFWFTKDLADKVSNLFFVIFEIVLLVKLFGTPLFWQKDWVYLGLFLVSVPVATVLFYYLSLVLSFIGFWIPENPWPPRFLFNVVTEILSGGIFPLDILPAVFFGVFRFFPTSFLLFGPLNIYLGRLSLGETILNLGAAVVWLMFFYVLANRVWLRGLRVYAAEGR